MRVAGALIFGIFLGSTLAACAAGPVRSADSMARTEAAQSPHAFIVSQIHNAPGWRPSHGYRAASAPFTRVVSGPGWDPASGTWRPGEPLAAYQLVSKGSCASSASAGPSGVGSAIQDGSCVWRYLSRVDYVSLTGWAFDNQRWHRGTLYHYLDHVVTGEPLRAYALEDETCRSAAAPSGEGNAKTAEFVTPDGCHWRYLADVLYSSERSYIPTETFTSRRSPATLHMRANYVAELWNDREYVAGEHGEASPIRLEMHDDYGHEGGVIIGCRHSACPHLVVMAAPGESFRDHRAPNDALTGYDPAWGVAIRNSLPYRFPYEPAGLDVHDNYVDLLGLEIKSVHGAAVNGMSSFGNSMTILGSILEGGSDDQWTSHAAVTTDTSAVIANSLVIASGPIGVMLKYPGYVLHSTIVAPTRRAGSVGIETFSRWYFDGTVVASTAIFGFAHAVAHDHGPPPWSARSAHNLTDAPAGDSGPARQPYAERTPAETDVLPGTTYAVPVRGVFTAFGSDWRSAAGSPLRGAGRAFGRFVAGCGPKEARCSAGRAFDVDSPDIIGTPRPQAGRIDVGAWQSCPLGGCVGRGTGAR